MTIPLSRIVPREQLLVVHAGCAPLKTPLDTFATSGGYEVPPMGIPQLQFNDGPP